MSELHPISGHNNESRVADVLFVHGLGGHPLETWRHGEDASTSWPHWLGEEFPALGVWSIGYAASPLSKWSPWGWSPWTRKLAGHGSALPVQGRQILDRLALRGFGKRPLFFICHSLGGLVAKQVLRTAHENNEAEKRAIFDSTKGILFLGTPHRGANLASFISQFKNAFGSTVTMEGLRAHDAHLEDLALWFRRTMPKDGVDIRTYYEELDVGPLLIVNSTSADAGCGADPVGLPENHLSIAKPAKRDAHVCDVARKMLRAYASAWPAAAPPAAACVLGMRPASPLFVGRAEELRQLIERVQQRKSTAVVAPAGYGKTELAAQALDYIERENGLAALFPDGVFLLDLYVVRGGTEAIWQSLANAIAGQEATEREEPIARVRRALTGKQTLIVIEGGEEADGVEGRIGIATLLGEIAGRNRWLLLTRSKGQAGNPECVFIRDPLSAAESGALFDGIASGVLVDAESRDGILRLVHGHPLALRWAAAQVGAGIDHARAFLRDWAEDTNARLGDPADPIHTLEWLFARTTRRLDETSLLVLGAAGKLSHAAFPLAAIQEALCLPEGAVRDSLRLLTRLQLLRLAEDEDHWQFVHVLAYQFARRRRDLRSEILANFGVWCRTSIYLYAGSDGRTPDMGRLDTALAHASALLIADEGHVLWAELAEPALYHDIPRIRDLGSLGRAHLLLAAIERWIGTLPASESASNTWLREASAVLNFRGQIRRTQGDLPGALEAFQQSLRVRQRLADSDPSHTQWQRDLSISLNNIGNVRRDQGDLPGALEAFQQSLRVRQRLADSDPSHTQWQRDLSVSLNNIGNVRRDQGDLPGALEAFQQSFRVRQRLADYDPSHTEWQRDLSVSLTLLAETFEASGRLTEGITFAQRSLAIDQRLAALDSTNATWQEDLAISRCLVERLRAAASDD